MQWKKISIVMILMLIVKEIKVNHVNLDQLRDLIWNRSAECMKYIKICRPLSITPLPQAHPSNYSLFLSSLFCRNYLSIRTSTLKRGQLDTLPYTKGRGRQLFRARKRGGVKESDLSDLISIMILCRGLLMSTFLRPSDHYNNSLTVKFVLALTQIIDVVNRF